MPLDRRSVLSAGVGAGLFAAAKARAGPRSDAARGSAAPPTPAELGLAPGAAHDQSAPLQAAIDEAANRGAPLRLPPGRFRTGALTLRPGTRIIGAARTTTLEFAGGAAFLSGEAADGVLLEGLVLDGAYKRLGEADALVSLKNSRALSLRDLEVTRASANGISLIACAGSLADCTVTAAMQAGIRSLDAEGLDILHNHVADCANNGIQVWRSDAGWDATTVANNRIARIRADSGGSGENGNGVNVFRAGGVLVTGNRISDCAYSGVRGNAASDIQMIANACARLGEVALYAEFGFEGALIANNLVDTAATGISVTNFNDGGRLAIVQGNLVRNLFRREQEPEDKRGEGITVEADTAVTGNVIENAPTAGLVIGWGAYVRQVVATGNLIRSARVGILVSSDASAGACLLANNMISGAADGGIRTMDATGEPTGPDLAHAESSDTRLSVAGNLAV
jgi:uncharacterized secreted repeat protein (TIGR03808 family)